MEQKASSIWKAFMVRRSIEHHLLQSLPVKGKADLDHCPDLISISKGIDTLREELQRTTIDDKAQPVRGQREELHWRKRHLESEEIIKWQQIQLRKDASETTDEAPLVAEQYGCVLPSWTENAKIRLSAPLSLAPVSR